jgi:DNA-binding response OmpR family regulator
VLLDLGLPRKSGFELLEAVRASGNQTPIMVLTARDGVEDRVSGLDFAADDYLVKPFEFEELLARLRAIVRRRDGPAQSLIGTDELQLDLGTRELNYRGSRVPLFRSRVRVTARAVGAARRDTLARAAGRTHLRMGRSGQQQRVGGHHPNL